mmetsp:Transcript_3744/g.15580  ORF Transcript_3744/g.15580 Transcript_3744/m.15580 type:complete len:240 (-) Transcript_3744:809-1528(-)
MRARVRDFAHHQPRLLARLRRAVDHDKQRTTLSSPKQSVLVRKPGRAGAEPRTQTHRHTQSERERETDTHAHTHTHTREAAPQQQSSRIAASPMQAQADHAPSDRSSRATCPRPGPRAGPTAGAQSRPRRPPQGRACRQAACPCERRSGTRTRRTRQRSWTGVQSRRPCCPTSCPRGIATRRQLRAGWPCPRRRPRHRQPLRRRRLPRAPSLPKRRAQSRPWMLRLTARGSRRRSWRAS